MSVHFLIPYSNWCILKNVDLVNKCYDSYSHKNCMKQKMPKISPKFLDLHLSIQQRCPTLSSFATCGDRPLKCGVKKLFQIFALEKPNIKLQYILFLSNVATWAIWLNNAGIKGNNLPNNIITLQVQHTGVKECHGKLTLVW